MKIARALIIACAGLALAAPAALADECGSESIYGQSGPDFAGAGSHVYMLLSQYDEEDLASDNLEKSQIFDLAPGGSITANATPFAGQAVRAGALSAAGGRFAATWWSAGSSQRALGGAAGVAPGLGASVGPTTAEVPETNGLQTHVAIDATGAGAVIDVNDRVHRLGPDGTLGPALDAGAPRRVVVDPNGTVWFATSVAAKPVVYRWDVGAAAPVAVPVTVPFGFSYDFDAVADGAGGVRLLSRASSGAGFVHVRADDSVVAKKLAGIPNAQLDARPDGTFAITTLFKRKGSTIRTLSLRAGGLDDTFSKPVTIVRSHTHIDHYDTALQPGGGALASFGVERGNGDLRVTRITGSKRGKLRTIKPRKYKRSGFDSPQIATTTSGSAWILFIAYDVRSPDSACGRYYDFSYGAAQVSANGKPKQPKSVPGAHPLGYYVGG